MKRWATKSAEGVSLRSHIGEFLWRFLHRSGLLALGRLLVRRLGGGGTRVLCYHRIGGGGLPVEEFERHLDHLCRHYRLLAVREIVEKLERGEPLPRDGIAVTVDDGFVELVEEPVLGDLARARATVFVVTGGLPARGRFPGGGEVILGEADLARLRAAGVAVGSHTRRHRRLVELSDPEVREELDGSRSDLGGETDLVAYPWGLADSRIARRAREAGYRGGFTTGGGPVSGNGDPLLIPRIHLPGRASVARLACEAAGLVARLRRLG